MILIFSSFIYIFFAQPTATCLLSSQQTVMFARTFLRSTSRQASELGFIDVYDH